MRLALALVASLALGACGGTGSGDAPLVPAGELTDVPHRDGETLILYVGSESFGVKSFDFEVAIDGRVVARDVLDCSGLDYPRPHKEIRLALAPGEHLLEARTRNGKASLSQRFPVRGKHWACLTYWDRDTAPPGASADPKFELRLYDERPRFL